MLEPDASSGSYSALCLDQSFPLFLPTSPQLHDGGLSLSSLWSPDRVFSFFWPWLLPTKGQPRKLLRFLSCLSSWLRHSQVYIAREIATGEIVALMKIRMDKREREREG
ncbi:unnamed protein product [Linum tenue]|uniref:Uncharacterized protein n=1 Tax=Linum tenue TaxID=586396 RepID=A0AAV0R5A1_9ROSI|nr:unnamed protein product [Linum tenue]